jgi:prevent-host-death family protein
VLFSLSLCLRGRFVPAALSIQEAQAQLPHLVEQAARGAEPCYIRQNGKNVAVLVSLRCWRRRQPGKGRRSSTTAQALSLRAYRKKLSQLGREYWLDPEEQARLRELVEKEDEGAILTIGERRELRGLVKRHERLLLKRAAALQASL